tara:strand:- start:2733 stop:3272 length:540 start_codon:yes stop_codon:yes gene_type:complete
MEYKIPKSKEILWGKNGLIRKLNLAPKNREEELKLRQKMLKTHQSMGLMTLGMMSYQYYLGKKLLDSNQEYKMRHKYLGYTTFCSYIFTASLSIFAPPAFRYSDGISSIKLHKYLSYIHFIGMLTMPYLGYLSSGALDYKNNSGTIEYNYSEKASNIHHYVGNITFYSFSLAFLTTLLP